MRVMCLMAAILAAYCPMALAEGEQPQPESTVLGEIDSEITDGNSFITIRLGDSVKPSPIKLEDHNSFLQLRIPNTMVPESGKFLETKIKEIPKLAVFQITRKDAGIRLFTEGETKALRDALKVDHLGNRIVVSVDAKAMQQMAAKKQAEAIVASTEVRADIPPPADAIKGTATSEATTWDFPYADKVRIIAIFLGILCAGFGLLLVAKPFLRRTIKQVEAESVVSMKTLSSMPLAAKQKLSLVQVGNQKLLLGVTPENISFLTAIEGENQSRQRRSDPPPAVANKYLEMMRKRPIADMMDKTTIVKEAQTEAAEQPIKLKKKPKIERQTGPKPGASFRDEVMAKIESEPATEVKISSRSTREDVTQDTAEPSPNTISDVTQLIRDKIKSLPKI